MARTRPPGGGPFYWWQLYPQNLWQPFKWTRKNPNAHSGIDIGMPIGTPIVAPEDATYMNGTMEPWGGQVNLLVQWNDGAHVLTFLHLSQIAPHSAGEIITGGTLLGASGQPPSPQYGTGAHLHFEVTHGSLAPYEQYSPTRPSIANYPIDGKPFLQQLDANGGPLGALNSTPGSGTVQSLAGSLPGFFQLAQGLDEALRFTTANDIQIVGQDTGVPNPFINLRAALLRAFFVILGLFLLGLAFWNLIARPALGAAEPATAGAASIASMMV